MKKLILLLLASLSLVTSSAQAYDSDTHLRMTYAAARFSGINHETALMLAMADQWIDVSALTTPMGSLFIGTRLRRLFHFPTSRSMKIDNRDSHGKMDFNTVTKAARLDPMGAELIAEGMKTGNLLMVGAGLHTLQDTYGHEGWLAEIGHATGGHEPDRPWRNWDKYQEMSVNLFRAMISIRKLLPPEALDFQTPKETGAWSNNIRLDSAESLSSEFIEKFENIANNNIFSDPRYTVKATEFILKNIQELGFIKKEINVQTLIDDRLFDGKLDIHLIFKEIVKNAFHQEVAGVEIFERKALFDDILRGYGLDESSPKIFQEIAQWPADIRETVLNRLVNKVLDSHVPDTLGNTALGTSNQFVWESAGPLRDLEMKLRMNDWRLKTAQLFKQDWHFDEARNYILLKAILVNPFEYLKIGMGKFFGLTKAGALKVARIKSKAIPEISKDAADELEKYVREVEHFSEDTNLVTMPKDYRKKWIKMILNFAWFDWAKGNSRLKPGQNNLAFLFADAFNKLIEKGEVKALITETELKALSSKIMITNPLLVAAIMEGKGESGKETMLQKVKSVIHSIGAVRCERIYSK